MTQPTDLGLQFDVNDLPMDVFEISEVGLTVSSLTAGHGLTENGASSTVACDSSTFGSNGSCCGPVKPI